MNLILDTHTYLWQASDPDKLTKAARRAIESPRSSLYVSAASLWEVAIFIGLKRIEVQGGIRKLFEQSLKEVGIQALPIEVGHLDVLARLPFFHRDPFDRLILAQAKVLGAKVIGKDEAFDRYGIERVWK